MKKIDNVHMNVLSMGMSNDFEVAIEEGATIVRVGNQYFRQKSLSSEINKEGNNQSQIRYGRNL